VLSGFVFTRSHYLSHLLLCVPDFFPSDDKPIFGPFPGRGCIRFIVEYFALLGCRPFLTQELFSFSFSLDILNLLVHLRKLKLPHGKIFVQPNCF